MLLRERLEFVREFWRVVGLGVLTRGVLRWTGRDVLRWTGRGVLRWVVRARLSLPARWAVELLSSRPIARQKRMVVSRRGFIFGIPNRSAPTSCNNDTRVGENM